MGYKAVGNLAVKTGEYTPDGATEKKGIYQDVGTLMQDEGGKQFLLINKHINFAGFKGDSENDSVLVNIFSIKKKKSDDNEQS